MSRYLLFLCVFLWNCESSKSTDKHEPVKKREKGYVYSFDTFEAPTEFQISFQKINPAKTIKKIHKEHNSELIRQKNNTLSFDQAKEISSKSEKLTFQVCHSKPDMNKAGISILNPNSYLNIRHFNKTNGLKHQSISSLTVDGQGRVWAGTYDGLEVYDGKNFHHFSENQGLPEAEVTCSELDNKGNVWIGTRSGLVMFDGKKLHVVISEYFKNSPIYAIHVDSQGFIWVSSNKCLAKIKQNDIQIFQFSEVVYSLLVDKEKRVWIDCSSGLYCLQGSRLSHVQVKWGEINDIVETPEGLVFGTNTGLYYLLNELQIEKINLPHVTCLVYDSGNEALWTGTQAGVYKIQNKLISKFSENDGLSENNVLSLAIDKQSIVWIGTSNGLNFYDPSFFYHYTEKSGMPSDYHYTILENNQKQKFLGGNYGLIKMSGTQIEHYTFQNLGIFSGIVRENNEYCFGTNSGLLLYNGQDFTHANLKSFFPKQGLEFIVTDILEDNLSNIWIATTYGLACYNGKNVKIYTVKQGLLNNVIYDLEQDSEKNIWIATDKGLNKLDKQSFTYYTEKEGFTSHPVKSIKALGKNLWIATFGSGLIKFDGTWFEHYATEQGLNSDHIFSIIPSEEEIWVGTRFGICKLAKNKNITSYGYEEGFLGIGCNGNAAIKDYQGNLWFCTNNRLTSVNLSKKDSLAPSPHILDLSIFGKKLDWSNLPAGVQVTNHEGLDMPENLSLPYTLNYLTFSFNGITTRFPQKVQFQYKLEGFDTDWREITFEDKAHYTNLPSGKYQFILKASNSASVWSQQVSFQFRIRPPWWKTWWFLCILAISTVLTSIFFVRWREKSLREEQKRLQKIVEEQTFEIRAALEDVQIANEEINAQAEELKQQNDILHEQQLDIQSKNKQITDSLNYGKRIQEAMLPDEKWLLSTFQNSFVFLKPKDIVSGDFYWLGCVGDKKIFAAVDCTGHGVPGAFMSMIGHELLNEIVLAKNITRPDLILNELNIGVRRILKQHSSENYDGMDVSLVCIDEQKKEILFAGAQNPMYVIENDEFKILPADKKSIGGKQIDANITFTLQTVLYQSNIQLFLASDGFQDQFGGNKGRKYMVKNFRELLFSLKTESPENQINIIKKTLIDWKGRYEQMDDILVVGIHLK